MTPHARVQLLSPAAPEGRVSRTHRCHDLLCQRLDRANTPAGSWGGLIRARDKPEPDTFLVQSLTQCFKRATCAASRRQQERSAMFLWLRNDVRRGGHVTSPGSRITIYFHSIYFHLDLNYIYILFIWLLRKCAWNMYLLIFLLIYLNAFALNIRVIPVVLLIIIKILRSHIFI